MKPEQLYQNLKELAERFHITVSEESFRRVGVRVQSGYCKVKGKSIFIMDRNAKLNEKVELLARFLNTLPHEDHYVMPAVRDYLNTLAPAPQPPQEGTRSDTGGDTGATPGSPSL